MKSLLRIKLMNISVLGYRFSPTIITTLTTILLLYTMNFMGQWQYGKALYKDNLLEKISERKNLAPVSFGELSKSIEDRMFTPVIVEGYFDERIFLYDNRILKGQVGYDVYSPFKLDSGDWILVNRGFVNLGLSRDILPAIETPKEKQRLQGLLDKIPSKGVILADNLHSAKSWPVVLQYLDTEEIKDMLNQPVYDMILRLDKGCEENFECAIPALNLDSAKNYGYTFQWYAMIMTLSIIYFVFNTKKSGSTDE